MSKILIIAWGVYPNTGGSTIIVNNIAEGFKKEKVVIAGQIPSTTPTKNWESFSDIKLQYLNPFPFNFRRPERYIRWLKIRTLCKQVKDLVREEGVDRILAIFPDEYYSYIAYKVSKELNIPFSIWFHNSYLENREGVLKMLAKRLQPRFFSSAKNVFVMSDGLRDEMKKVYPSVNFQTLVHGFKLSGAQQIEHSAKSTKVRFLYSGSLNQSCMDASLRLLKTIMKNPDYEIVIFSGNPQTFQSHGIIGENIIFKSFLPLDEFVAQLYKYDVMLLPHGLEGLRSAFEYKTIFPTRTIPLLFSGKPILAHSPKGSFLNEFLSRHDCSVLVDEPDEHMIETAIDEILNNEELVNKIVRNAQKASKQFKLENVVKKLIEYL